jgi:hypothetical protein
MRGNWLILRIENKAKLMRECGPADNGGQPRQFRNAISNLTASHDPFSNESDRQLIDLFEHDLFEKPVSALR